MTTASKKSLGYSPKFGPVAVQVAAGHEGLENREEDAAVLRDAAPLGNFVRLDADERVLLESGEGAEIVKSLIGEVVAVGQEQNARPALRLTREVPSRFEQLPDDLESDRRLAGSGRERQQNASVAFLNPLERPFDRVGLIIARRPFGPLFDHRHRRKAVAPGVGERKSARPLVFRRGPRGDMGLQAGVHVDLVDAPPVGRKGEAGLQFAGIMLGLPDAFGVEEVEALGLDHRELHIAIYEDVIRDFRLCPPPRASTARRDHLAANAARLNHAPTDRLQRGIDQFGAGLRFVHAARLCLDVELACEGFLQEGLFQFRDGGELAGVEEFKVPDSLQRVRSVYLQYGAVRLNSGKEIDGSQMSPN